MRVVVEYGQPISVVQLTWISSKVLNSAKKLLKYVYYPVQLQPLRIIHGSPTMTNTSLSGLTATEVTQRRAQGLGNKVPPPTGRTYVQIFRENIFTFINAVIFLLGAALVMVGRPGDALVSLGVISANVLISVVQEIRAKRTLDRIALLARPTAQVVRDGAARNVPPEELVVGDVLQVGPGDQIVLDGRVIATARCSKIAVDRRIQSRAQEAGRSRLFRQFLRQRQRALRGRKSQRAKPVQSNHRRGARLSPRADAAAK
jgi:magnesium-transporting ATPase (P-type)